MSTSTQIVTGVDFAFVPVKDFDAALEFYGTTLGLPLSVRYERVPGAEFETGNLTLLVMDSSALGLEHEASRNAIAFRVDDVAAARAELESRGVRFAGDIVDSGVCHQAYFSDPEGHSLILHHRYAPR
jgi:catechol 2,3-dioxygenase-like lactoylglutathione lyase family enzyme